MAKKLARKTTVGEEARAEGLAEAVGSEERDREGG